MNKTSNDSETLAKGQQVITACAFIHKQLDGEHKVLLAKRSSNKKFLPNLHELPGGHINFGEEVPDGLKREVLEELNIKINIGDSFFVFTYTNNIKGSHSIEVIYFATLVNEDVEINLNPEDHSEYDWFGEKDFNKISKLEGDHEIQAISTGLKILNGNYRINLG